MLKHGFGLVSLGAALAFSLPTAASAATVEYTLTVPIKITLPPAGSPNVEKFMQSNGGGGISLRKFTVSCALGGGNLAYSSGGGSADNAVATGSTATNGGSLTINPSAGGGSVTAGTAKVIMTFDAASTSAMGAASGGGPSQYVCWAVFPEVNDAPLFFVQGSLAGK